MAIRQPIVSVLGHVDHGKTSVLDRIRGTTVAKREAGAITQHIGATEIPLETVYEICGNLIGSIDFKVPGLLFIDTPGHHSFTTLRSRGGALADLAILVIDINEGFKPQTRESINILKRYKTPFVVAANKVDLVHGWRSKEGRPFIQAIQDQPEFTLSEFDAKFYRLVGSFSDIGLSADRYDAISDFTKNIAIVPMSAKTGEGVPDLLMILVGLAQRFLEGKLEVEEEAGHGTVLEVKEEKGLGKTIDMILYRGTINKGDTIVIGTIGEPLVTKVKALLKPKPMDEIRDPRERFASAKSVSAAAGIKISAPDLEGAIAGAPVRVAKDDVDAIVSEIRGETSISVETQEDGIIVKADAIGSLEAVAYEAKEVELPLKRAEIGPISRRDVIDAATNPDPLKKVIFGFNVEVLPDAREELLKKEATLFESDIVYKLFEDYGLWKEKTKLKLEKDRRVEIVHPSKMKILPDCVFRVSKPAIFGVRVLAGRIRVGQGILREDGRVVGKIKSIRSGEDSLKEALTGQEVAVAVDGITIGRQLSVEDIVYTDIPESHAKELNEKVELNYDEKEVLERIFEIKRKSTPFWGM